MSTATATTTRTKWAIDPTHSEITFKVKHLMIANVKGAFQKFNASIEAVGTDFADARVQATLDAASIFTNEANRDTHLRSADFFDVEKFPQMRFVSTSVESAGDNWLLTGDLTIRDVTRPVVLEMSYEGMATDPWGTQHAAFSASAEIDREDWGLTWNVALEAGGWLVSRKVKIEIDAQLIPAS